MNTETMTTDTMTIETAEEEVIGARKSKGYFEDRMYFYEKYGTLDFTRYDPKIAAGKPKHFSNAKPYRINITCTYIQPLYELYKKKIGAATFPLSDAQRYDFECIIMTHALRDIAPSEKIKACRDEINNIDARDGDYIPYGEHGLGLYPVRAIGTIYQGRVVVSEQ